MDMTDTTVIEFSSWSKSCTGNIRSINEDACFDDLQNGIWAVADGMGGHQSGDLASRLITQSLGVLHKEKTLEETVNNVKDCLSKANLFLLDEAALREGNQTIGSTVVVFVVQNQRGAVLWVGDSRLYRMRDKQLQLLTSDHSQVQELVDIGFLQPEDAENHPAANVITRAIGAAHELKIDDATVEIKDGDTFLLCSDGLYKELSDEEISSILIENYYKTACEILIQSALKKECRDNVTAIVIDAFSSEQTVLRAEV